MQPVYRPSIPPEGMRPPGMPPPGPALSGLPPPQRPPAGYRPLFPVPSAPSDPFSQVPVSGFTGNVSSAPSVKPSPFNPPIQKLATMNLNPSSYSEQLISNGVPDLHSPSPASDLSQTFPNGNQSNSGPQHQINAHNNEVIQSQSPGGVNTLQQMFQKNSAQSELFPPMSQSAPVSQEQPPPSSPSINSMLPSVSKLETSLSSQTSAIPSSLTTSGSEDVSGDLTSSGSVSEQHSLPPVNGSLNSDASWQNVVSSQPALTPISGIQTQQGDMQHQQPIMHPSRPGMQPQQPAVLASQPGMQPLRPGLHPPLPSMLPPQSGTQPLQASMQRPQSGLQPQHPGMQPPRPGMQPPRPGMQPSQPGMQPSQPGMQPSQPGMQPSQPGMLPSQPGMQPPQPGIQPPQPGMQPLQPGMQPHSPQPAMQPFQPLHSSMAPSMGNLQSTTTQIGPPRPGMAPLGPHNIPPGSSRIGPTSNLHIGPSRPSMPLNSQQVGPPRPGMPLSSSFMGPSPNAMPPFSSGQMISPQPPGMQPQKPGMPPPLTSSYMPSPGSGMPPPPSSSSMGAGPSMHLPPNSSSIGPAASPGMSFPPTSAMGPGIPPPPSTGMGAPGMPPPPGSMAHPQGSMQNRYPGSSPGGPMGGYSQGGQGRRLNPDDMPSPLQVMEEDKQCRTGEFITNMKGAVPPLVTTEYVVRDGGNASPRFMRSTLYNIPATQDMMKQAMVPFGLVISPMAGIEANEAPLYPGTSLANGPVRCNRCKGYMSPLMMFMDGGRRYQCLLCKQVNEVPADYYSHMDSQGARADKYQRPELCLGAYEFIATPEYCKEKLLPKEPAFIFVFEMSQMMMQRGIINLLCQNMKSLLQHLPKDEVPGQENTKSKVRVGFITYDSSVHFYKLDGLAPEMCIVCDKDSMFVPVPEGVLCDVEQVADNIEKLMECIPQNFQTSRETSGSLSCAIQAGMSALKASGRTGKLFVFHSSLPQIEGVGKLRNREDRKVLGTEREKAVLSPQNVHYNNLGQELVSVGCGVDFFLFNESYIDLATIGQVARLTGGQCYKYTFFQPSKDADRLLDDLRINISRNIAFDAVMRVRTSTGVRPVEFFGHFFMNNTHDIELAVVDCSKAVAVEIKHDDKITEEDGVYIQVALLYTSVGGQRRLRILNLALNICTQMADLYKNCDLDTLMNFFGKQAMFKFLETSAKQVKENLIARSAQILGCYRKNCATPSSAGQLILPELMKLLPLYVNCLSKCDALSGGQDLTCDDRSWHIYQFSTMTVESSVVYLYPRLIPLTEIDPQDTDIPPVLRTSYDKLSPEGSYLLENGLFMFVWVGSGTPSSWMKDVFGVSAPHQLDPVLSELPELENATSKRVRGIIEAIREQRKWHLRLFVVPQQGKHEVVMRNYLVEDKGVFGSPSYVDFLCHVHKEIRALLS